MTKAAAGRLVTRRIAEACLHALRPASFAMCGGVGLAVANMPAHAVTILPTFDSTITTSSAASTIESEINTALKFYSNFVNPISVSIDFQLAPSNAGYLGASLSTFYLSTYSSYTSSLLANASQYGNSPERVAYSHLGSGNKADEILATSADYRALGFTGTPGLYSANGGFNVGGSFDGIVYLSAKFLTGFGLGGTYNANRVIQHEVDEILGIGGSGSVLNTVQQDSLATPPVYQGKTYIGALDLYRYSSAGHPSLSTSATATAYFSINGGVTHLATFNQNSGGDYADWAGNAALVQDAFTTAGISATLTRTSPEVIAFEAIGYDLPEPASLALLCTSVLALGWARCRRI